MTRSMISSFAFAAAMLLSSAAMAQTTIAGKDVSAEDLPKVQAQCNTLAAVDQNSLASETPATDGKDADGASDSGPDTTVASGDQSATTSIDLSLLTIEDCKAAGLVK
jgi:hypothetical protein